MKELEISERFRALFAADGAFTGVACNNDLTSQTVAIPSLVFVVTTKPMTASGSALDFTLTVWVESRAEHRNLVDAVREKLLTTGKSALLSALNTAGGFDWRGWCAHDGDESVNGHQFRTPVSIQGIVLVL